MPETIVSETDDDHVTAFCRRHPRVDEAELRSELRFGPWAVREYLSELGILDDYPRRAATARGEETEGLSES